MEKAWAGRGIQETRRLEYRTADLRFLQRCPQDYLKVAPKEVRKVMNDMETNKPVTLTNKKDKD